MTHDSITRYYPNAVTASAFVLRFYRILKAAYNLTPNQVLLAHSICSDDVNSIEYPEEGRQMLGPFNLGGLNGYPFTGLTGMGAFANHIPEDGAALVFYAPHIGISPSGEPGKILRVGQQQHSACCGAMVKALHSLENGTLSDAPVNPFDYQQQTLESIVSRSSHRIQSSNNKLVEATEVIFEASGAMIDELVAKTDFMGKYMFVIGAMIINSDWQEGSFLELRRFDCYNIKTHTRICSHIPEFNRAQS
jgi:hypothetical protein